MLDTPTTPLVVITLDTIPDTILDMLDLATATQPVDTHPDWDTMEDLAAPTALLTPHQAAIWAMDTHLWEVTRPLDSEDTRVSVATLASVDTHQDTTLDTTDQQRMWLH